MKYWQARKPLLKVIAHKAVPERPDRSEPRVRKRRPKAYPLMILDTVGELNEGETSHHKKEN